MITPLTSVSPQVARLLLVLILTTAGWAMPGLLAVIGVFSSVFCVSGIHMDSLEMNKNRGWDECHVWYNIPSGRLT